MPLRLKPLSFLAAALLSCLLVLPFLSNSTPDGRGEFGLELELATDVTGFVQVYYDSGNGFREEDSNRVRIRASATAERVRLPLPTATLRALRFDPIDHAGNVRLRNAQIVGANGETRHRLNPADFSALQQIESLAIDGEELRFATTGNDPMFSVQLGSDIALVSQYRFLPEMLRRAVPVFTVLAILLVALGQLRAPAVERLNRLREKTGAALHARPATTLAAVALIAVALSTYPVVFLGKSFVAPNFVDGTYLLYHEFPTLPGTTSQATEDAKGADVGALFWAHIPYSFVQHDAVFRNAELPLWNRYNSAGTVLLGQGQSMFGDPMHLAVIAANGAAWAWDLKFVTAKWLLCLALGLIVWHGTRHLPCAALAALAAAFAGFFPYRLNHPAFFSFCYAPWILYAWLRIAAATRLRTVAGWCALLTLACVAEMHSGTVKEAYMLLFSMNLAGVLVVLMSPQPWSHRLLRLGAGAWAGLILVLLTAPSWLTFLDCLKRAYTAYNSASAFQLLPSVALGIFDEVFYRPFQAGDRVFNPASNFLILTGVLYFVAAFRHAAASPIARAMVWSALLPVALAFGIIPPQWIIKVPFLANVAHIDNTFSCVLVILMIAVAGFGWRTALDRLGTAEGNQDLMRIGWAYVLLVVPWIAMTHVVHRPIYGYDAVVSFLQWGQRLPVSDFVWSSLLLLTVAGVALLLAVRGGLRREFTITRILVIATALIVMLWRTGVHLPAVGPADYVFTPGDRVDFHAPSPAVGAVKADQSEPGRVVGLGGNLFPGWSGAYGLEGVNGPDALVNPYFRQLVEVLGLNQVWGWRIYTSDESLESDKPALDFLNVRHYLHLDGDHERLARLLTPVKAADLDVYRSETAWPRAFFTTQAKLYESPSAFGKLVRESVTKPFAAVEKPELEKHPDLSAFLVAEIDRPGQPARDYQLTDNSTAFTIDATGPGLAVLHESWLHREFEARLDGQPVKYLRVNHAFKAIIVPTAGVHRVEFTYRPRRFTLSLALMAAGLALTLGSGIGAWRFGRPGSRIARLEPVASPAPKQPDPS